MNRRTRLQLAAPVKSGWERILSQEALCFVEDLATEFEPRREAALADRRELARRLDDGASLDFLPETREVREGTWKAAPLPADLLDRRVEITGPTDRKMMINALNSGANVFMADFEDSNSPTWDNLVQGQANLHDAARRTLRYTTPDTGKEYRLNERMAVLFVRPRGWHLPEKHVHLDGRPISASLFDFGLAFFHNARALVGAGTGPYFYLPKIEHHREARLWNDVFLKAQRALDLPVGTVKATVLVETIPAAFQMDEILYELREHSAGLNCGRWDYIFSFIKKHRARASFLTPDRSLVTMQQPFLRAYAQLAVRTCHRRGVHAMGGMSAYIPTKDEATNRTAFEQVRSDKLREASDGHDGT